MNIFEANKLFSKRTYPKRQGDIFMKRKKTRDSNENVKSEREGSDLWKHFCLN